MKDFGGVVSFNFIALLFVVTACSSDKFAFKDCVYYQPENSKIFDDDYTLHEGTLKIFELDTLTGFYHHSFQFFEEKDKSYLSFINEENRYLYIYDYSTGKSLKKINLKKEGPDGVGNTKLMGHFVHTLDSIFIYSYYVATIFLIDSAGKVLNKKKLFDNDNNEISQAYPTIRTEMPAFIKNRKLYIMGRPPAQSLVDHTTITNVIEIDIDSFIIRKLFHGPLIYNCANWGFDMKYRLQGWYNNISNKFIYSFGADPFVHETDHVNYSKKHFLGSKYFDGVEPFHKNRYAIMGEDFPREKVVQFEFTSPEYSSIVFDPFKKVYYRFVNLPLTEDQIDSPQRNKYFKPFSIIIADTDFKKIGEVKLPYGRYYPYMFFLTQEGLHIARYDEYEKNEEKLVFGILKLQRNL